MLSDADVSLLFKAQTKRAVITTMYNNANAICTGFAVGFFILFNIKIYTKKNFTNCKKDSHIANVQTQKKET